MAVVQKVVAVSFQGGVHVRPRTGEVELPDIFRHMKAAHDFKWDGEATDD